MTAECKEKREYDAALDAPVHLRCEYLENPIGIDVERPRLGWQLRSLARNQVQTAYRVLVASDQSKLDDDVGDLWDSGKVESSQSVHVEYQGRPLSSGDICYWKVQAWDGAGFPTPYSEVARFEMGLLEASDWDGIWIQAAEDISAPLLRKSIALADKQVHKARAYVCGLGYFELYINGNQIGTDVLVPQWTNYDVRELKDLIYPFDDQTSQRVLYVSYDVTDNLDSGLNGIGVILGNGWYNQTERNVEGKMWYGTPRMCLQLNIEYVDGTRQSIYTDETWVTSSSPITFNNIYYGEHYDARLEKPGWSLPDYDDSAWIKARRAQAPTGVLRSQVAPADRVVQTIRPIEMWQPQTGVYVFDLGQNISGWVKLKIRGERGTKLRLRFAEEIDDSRMLDFTSTGGKAQIQADVYVLKGQGWEEWEPRFTWHGFRYVEVTGLTDEPPAGLLEGEVVHTAVDRVGTFSCSSSLLNQIDEMYGWSQLTNLHGGVPSDCPHRERLGYTGDGHITAEAGMYCFDLSQFYTKWLQDISDAQNRNTGFVPHTVPFAGGGGGPGWGCACVLIPWQMYQFYADRRILDEHYGMMSHWMEYLISRADADYIITHEEPGSWCLGDWCTAGKLRIPPEYVNTFFFGLVSQQMAEIAGVLGKPADVSKYETLLQQIRQGMARRFLNDDRASFSIGAQGTEAFALAIGAVPQNLQAGVVEYLRHHVSVKKGGHVDTGIFGTPILLDVLTNHGLVELAYETLNKHDYPSYGYMLAQGATTLWETWEGTGSHNHPMFGSVVAWFYRVLAGIKPQLPGFARVIIQPRVIKDLEYVKASVHTVRGLVSSAWLRRNGELVLNVSIPANTSGKVFVPKVSSDPMVRESGETIWSQEGSGRLTDGINACQEQDSCIVFDIGSGSYTFISS